MEIKNRINGDKEEIKNMIKKKRSRSMHVIRIVLYMLRRKRRRKPFSNGNFWRRIVESVRHLKNDDVTIVSSSNIPILPSYSPVKRTSENITVLEEKEEASESSVDQLSDMVEVFTATSSSSSSGYGSAKSLRDMDCLDEDDDDGYDDDDDECYGDNDDGGDEMIDVKAEEFILRFYEQMRMQNQAYTERYKSKGVLVV